MTNDEAAELGSRFSTALATVDLYCADSTRMVDRGAQGWAIQGSLRCGLIVTAANAVMMNTGGSAGFWVYLYATPSARPVAVVHGDSLAEQLAAADTITLGQATALRDGLLPEGLSRDVEIRPHTVVTAVGGDRIEITNCGPDLEQFLVCDPHGYNDGSFFGFTLPRAELMTMLNQLTSALAERFGDTHIGDGQ